MFAWFKRGLALMPPKAYRWVAEMHEIAGFVGEDPTAHELYEGAAHFYERIAEDFDGDKKDVTALTEFLGKNSAGQLRPRAAAIGSAIVAQSRVCLAAGR